MSEQSNDKSGDDAVGISDEQLPDDLVPSEDNPLAEPLSEEEAPDDIDELDMMGGGSGDDSDEDSDDERSPDGESAPENDKD
ncbi:MAG: hypothetical protein ACJ72P_02370 [Nocardioides sp.]|jgi:hypothetical protein